MPTLVVKPFFFRLLSSSLSAPTSLGSSFPCCRLSVSSTSSWIFQRFQGTTRGASIHSSPATSGALMVADGRCRDRGGLPGCAFGVQSPNRNGRHLESSSNGSRMHPVQCSEYEEERLADEELEGLEKWTRGGGVVHKLAKVHASVLIEIGAVIHAHAIIGADTQISSGSVVGSHVVIGSHSKLGFNVALQNCSVGNSCILHSGVCVGQDAHNVPPSLYYHGLGRVPLAAKCFGFTVNDKGELVKKPQMLKVQIGNNVEIGANTCIDRGSWRDTIIGDHTKIDNLVQVGHNVVVGRCCMLCGQVGLAGSSTLGDYVVMGGQSGVADHVSVTSKVRIAAKSGVTSNIVEPGDYAGFPAVPVKEWRRSVVNFRKLSRRSEVVTDNSTEV